MIPSPEQQHIYDTVPQATGNYIIVASAGSGKTTVIRHLVRSIPATTSILVLAFNKSAEEQLTTTLPPTADCMTFHKHGLNAMRSLGGRIKIDGNKVSWLLKDHLADDKKYYRSRHNCKVVDLAKNAGVGLFVPNSPEHYHEIIAHHELTEDYDIQLCMKLLELSNADTKRVDFSDMLYLPLLLKLRFPRYRLVFVDEAQDTNALQRAILLQTADRLVAVGDPSQAIYGFRGADHNAMAELQRAFSAQILPLSVSFRCSQRVVELAQRYDSGISLNASEAA